jgi:hypothetical protein
MAPTLKPDARQRRSSAVRSAPVSCTRLSANPLANVWYRPRADIRACPIAQNRALVDTLQATMGRATMTEFYPTGNAVRRAVQRRRSACVRRLNGLTRK